MNCREFRGRRMDLLDVSPDPSTADDLRGHLEVCPRCAQEFDELRELVVAIERKGQACASSDLKERIMNRITDVEEKERAAQPARRRGLVFRLALAAVVAVGFIAYRGLTGGGGVPISPFETFAQAAESTIGLKSVHIKANMRTPKGDNFALTGPNYDFAPVEIWTVAGETPKWRAQKPGRWVVMDGHSTTMLTDPGVGQPMAVRFPQPVTGIVEWLAPLLNINTLMSYEKSLAEKQGSEVACVEEKTAEGEQIVLTVRAKAQGDYSESNYLKNTSIYDSDNTRAYTFDARSHRLLSVQISMNIDGRSTVVFETTEIRYDVPVDPSLVNGEIPKNARLIQDPSASGGGNNSAMTPKEVAKTVMTAIENGDWQALHQFAGTAFDDPEIQRPYCGMKVLHIGEPFHSGVYGGVFVPCKIRRNSGNIDVIPVGIRNDNAEHQWRLDGGL